MLLEACIERATGKIVRVAPPMMLNWTAKERDGKNLCVVRMDREIFRPRGQEDLLVDRLDKHWVTYPGEELLRDRAVRARKTLLGRDLTESEDEAVERSVQSTPLWRIDPKHISPNAALYLEHMTAETPVPIFDVRMMETATGTDESEVSAAGTRDYNGLDTWWASEKIDPNNSAWAKCYNEGAGDLSVVLVSGASHTPTGTYYDRIYPAAGHRHDGTRGSGGAYISVADAATGVTISAQKYARVEGLRFVLADGNSPTRGIVLENSTHGCVLSSNLFVHTSGAGTGLRAAILPFMSLASETIYIYNNIVYGRGAAGRDLGIAPVKSEVTTNYVVVANNSVRGCGDHAGAYGYRWYAAAGTLNVTSTNNVGAGDQTADFGDSGAGGAVNVTQTYCLSIDDTADDWGGAGNLINQTAADVFVTPASDLHLKDKDSPAWRAGVAVAGNNTDAIGQTWPDPPSMGALELFVGGPFPHYTRRRMQGGMISMGIG